MYNPYQNFQQYPQFARPLQKQEAKRVKGKSGALALPLAPDSSDLALDIDEPIVWLITTDSAGYPTVTGYSIAPLQSKEQQDASRFDAIEKRLNDLEGMMHESDFGKNKSEQHNDTVSAS